MYPKIADGRLMRQIYAQGRNFSAACCDERRSSSRRFCRWRIGAKSDVYVRRRSSEPAGGGTALDDCEYFVKRSLAEPSPYAKVISRSGCTS
uniref:Uncharacterized protein n=1 Tax=Methylocapsa acidiphila TaxID=133552 RepID=Q2VNJ6_METAI|nr:hypothetical protein orf93 [Methylocapsa acidiphila]